MISEDFETVYQELITTKSVHCLKDILYIRANEFCFEYLTKGYPITFVMMIENTQVKTFTHNYHNYKYSSSSLIYYKQLINVYNT